MWTGKLHIQYTVNSLHFADYKYGDWRLHLALHTRSVHARKSDDTNGPLVALSNCFLVWLGRYSLYLITFHPAYFFWSTDTPCLKKSSTLHLAP